MGEHLDRAVSLLDEIDGMAFGKVSAALDSLQTNLLLAKSEADHSRATIAALVGALETILANTEADAIPHIAHSGMTAYQALAKDISDCARSALQLARGSKGDE